MISRFLIGVRRQGRLRLLILLSGFGCSREHYAFSVSDPALGFRIFWALSKVASPNEDTRSDDFFLDTAPGRPFCTFPMMRFIEIEQGSIPF